MGKIRYYEDVVIGEEFRSRTRTITETDVVTFASLSDDWSEVHISEQFAKGTAYGRRIAHGLLGLAITEGLKLRGGADQFAGIASLGWTWDFRKPVFFGDTIHVRCRLQRQAHDEGSRAGHLLPRAGAREPARGGGARGRAPAHGRDAQGGQVGVRGVSGRTRWARAATGGKIVTAEAAAELVRDGATVGVEGAGRLLLAEAVMSAIERRFLVDRPPAQA